MSRRVRIIMIFLLLGAVVNVSVAWGVRFVIREDPRRVIVNMNDPSRTTLLYITHNKQPEAKYDDYGSGFGRDGFMVIRGTTCIDDFIARTSVRMGGRIPKVSAEEFNRHLSLNSPFRAEMDDVQRLTPSDRRVLVEYVAGWPLRSMRYVERMTSDVVVVRSFEDAAAELHGGMAIPARFAELRHVAIPLRPVLFGFLINTMFFAALLWLLICGPFALRRAQRRRRGLCEKCAYPVGASPVCSECGAAVRRRNAARDGVAGEV